MTIESYYRERLEVARENQEELIARCPFKEHKHQNDDDKASFAVNKHTGLWICFLEHQGGNIAQFHSKMEKVSLRQAEAAISDMFPGISPDIVAKFKWNLAQSEETLNYLKLERLYKDETIERFELGWDPKLRYITIPVFEAGRYVLIKGWQGPNVHKDKFIFYKNFPGADSKTRLHPSDNIQHDDILLCEGFGDMMLADQEGYYAVTSTGGAGSWQPEFATLFRGKKVTVIYDTDKAGQAGAKKVIRSLRGIAGAISNVVLPAKDLTEYFLTGKKKEDLDHLIGEARVEEQQPTEPSNTRAIEVRLQDTTREKYYNCRLRTVGLVSGKDLSPYLIPKKVGFYCAPAEKSICQGCRLFASGGEAEVDIPLDGHMLQLIKCSEYQQKSFLKDLLNLPRECRRIDIRMLDTQNLEELRVMPDLGYSDQEQSYVVKQIFVLGHNVPMNETFTLEGVMIPDPRTQYATLLCDKLSSVAGSLDTFKLTDKQAEELKVYQVSAKGTVKAKIQEIVTDLAYNVTKIYGRDDLHIAALLVMFSPLAFNIFEKEVTRGWAEALIIGDTKTGKSETLTNLIRHHKGGAIASGEAVSAAGLIGGLSQIQNTWSVNWGLLPINDRRMVVIDEVSGMPTEMIALFSGPRSSGVADLTKIQKARTRCRVRTIWLSNPRSQRQMDTYTYGIMTVPELIGNPEDIARFDLVLILNKGEVDTRAAYRADHKVHHRYTSKLASTIIQWAWSRKREDIKFGKDTETAILDQADMLSKKYSSAIPIVEPAEQRMRVARLTAGCAALTYSTEDGLSVLVKPEHAKFIGDFLDQIYSKPASGYYDYSHEEEQADVSTPERFDKMFSEFAEFRDWSLLAKRLLKTRYFRKRDLVDQVGYTEEEGRLIFKWLSKEDMVLNTSAGYVKTPALLKFLRYVDLHQESKKRGRSEF